MIIAGRRQSSQTGRSIEEQNKINTFEYVFRNSLKSYVDMQNRAQMLFFV